MEWINIHSSTVRGEAFIDATPIQRGTWLCLLHYCCNQENSGIIFGASNWSDRKWQQVAGVTKDEVAAECKLYRTSGEDVLVEFYPLDKQKLVQQNRRGAAKTNRKRDAERSATHKSQRDAERDAERELKGKEGKGSGMEGEGNAPAPECNIPGKAECVVWAKDNEIDPDWVARKWENLTGTHGWERNGRMIDWKRLFPMWFMEDVRLGRFVNSTTSKTQVSPSVLAVAENQKKIAAQKELRELQDEIASLTQCGAEVPAPKKQRELELLREV